MKRMEAKKNYLIIQKTICLLFINIGHILFEIDKIKKYEKKNRKCIDKRTILQYNKTINKKETDKEKRRRTKKSKGGNSTENIIQSPFTTDMYKTEEETDSKA